MVPLNMFKPSIDFLAGRSKALLLLWIFFFKLFMFLVYLCYAALSVPCSLVVPTGKCFTSWLIVFSYVFVTFPYGMVLNYIDS